MTLPLNARWGRKSLAIAAAAAFVTAAATAGLAASATNGGHHAGPDPRIPAGKALPASKRDAGSAHIPAARYTFPDQGVNLGRAAISPPLHRKMGTLSLAPTALTSDRVLASFQAQAAPGGVLGDLLGRGPASVALQTVTETTPVVPDVTAGVPYQAWVVTYKGAPPVPAPEGADGVTCTFVGVMKVDGEWTEFFEDCPPPQ